MWQKVFLIFQQGIAYMNLDHSDVGYVTHSYRVYEQ